MATTRPITSFFQPVGKFSENENEAVIGGEAEAETMECENGKLFSHVLNLSVAAACRLTSVRNMIGTLNGTFFFFHFSPKRQRFLEQVLE